EALQDAISGGTSWSAPVTVAAYPGETVTLVAPSGSGRVLYFSSSASQYIIVSNLHLDASNVSDDGVKITDNGVSAASHIRLSGCEIKNVPATTGSGADQGILITVNLSAKLYSDYNEILNCTIHDIGGITGDGNHEHGMYVESSYNLIDGVETYNNSAYGLQIYKGSGPTDRKDASNII